jgi:preprotein translocase subunit YajC
VQALGGILPMILVFGIFYFVLIRPQVRKQKEHQALLAKLGKGDEVITRGGIIGKITGVGEADVVVVELQDKVRVRIARSYIDGKWPGNAADTRPIAASSAAA